MRRVAEAGFQVQRDGVVGDVGAGRWRCVRRRETERQVGLMVREVHQTSCEIEGCDILGTKRTTATTGRRTGEARRAVAAAVVEYGLCCEEKGRVGH